MKKRCAVFDLDGTLLSRNSSFLYGRFLFRHKLLSKREMCILLGHYLYHLIFHGSPERLHRSVFSRLFRGKEVAVFRALIPEFVEGVLPGYVYAPVMERFLSAKKAGWHVVILSCSPQFLVEEIGKWLGADVALGTVYGTSQGYFDEISSVMDGCDKARFVEENLRPYYDIVAYSDSYSDVPFLEAADNAVVVRPKGRLRALSRQKMWETVE